MINIQSPFMPPYVAITTTVLLTYLSQETQDALTAVIEDGRAMMILGGLDSAERVFLPTIVRPGHQQNLVRA